MPARASRSAPDDVADREAARLLAELRDALAEGGPEKPSAGRLRDALAGCRALPQTALLGDLVQMAAGERRHFGAHYTRERDVLRVLRPLFLSELQTRLDAIEAAEPPIRAPPLREFLAELRRLRLFDPACGAGNFLILAYRELRRLETRALVALRRSSDRALDLRAPARVDLAQCHGVELLDWPARVAAFGLRLIDHQCDLELAHALGEDAPGRTIAAAPALHVANALRVDWPSLLPPSDDVLVLGNPPFVGKHYQSPQQRADMARVLGPAFHNTGDLDYAACWFIKAAEYCRHTRARCAFVATNSLCQGEQVPLLWGLLFGAHALKIHFAHRTFRWTGETREKARVHVVIVGFGAYDRDGKQLFEAAGDDDPPRCESVVNISPYLTSGPDRFVVKARTPLSPGAPPMRCGNKPGDGGHLVFTDDARAELLGEEPAATSLFRRFTGADEFLHGGLRWCLWLKDADPRVLARCPRVLAAIEAVREFRRRSSAAPTRAAAARPTEFFYVSQPATDYIAVPEVSSERRRYIPVGQLPPDTIASNKLYVIASPSLFIFGLLSSAMHMAWTRVLCGRLKSDYQYSGSMVYNTFPWPDCASPPTLARVEAAARAVLGARASSPGSSLAALYDMRKMPPSLSRAHAALDRAVDRCYRREPFGSDEARFQHLFHMYERLSGPRPAPPR